MLREVRGRLALAQADFATARAELQAAAGTYEALHLLNPGACWRSALALAVAADDPGQAQRLTGSELADARRAGLPRPAGIALRTRGMIEGGERGLRDLHEAAEVLAASGARLEHARALVALGAALRRAGQRTAARAPLRTGLDLAHRCGAVRLAQQARAELLTAGAKPRRAVLTGLEALTASERRVAELAAAGTSNPEIAQALFVTLSTVEGHLRHAYRKLSISSRGQLAAALRSAAPETTAPRAASKNNGATVTRSASPPAMLPGVEQPAMVRVTLEFEPGSDPPRGQLLTGQAVYPFAGWLGLATALEHVIGADAPTRADAPADR